MSGFDNKYDPKTREVEILKFWEKNKVFKFDEKSKKPVYSIDTPPPTMSGKMHIGHSFSYTQADFIARYKRMQGHNVFYPFGTDDNGLATEKLVQKNEKVNLRKVSREEAVKITMKYLEKERPNFVADFKRIGLSCDFDLAYSSISPQSQRVSQKTFLDLYNKGLIEQREGPVPWDRVFQTPIAQAEMEDLERDSYLNYVKAKIEGTENTYMIFATTRPELIYAVVGMSVQDVGEYIKIKVGEEYWITGAATVTEKYVDFVYEIVEKLTGEDIIGEKIKIPVVDRVVEITHDIAIKADFGTGIAYFCTYGGEEDIQWASRHNVEPIQLVEKDGRLNKLAKEYDGVMAEEARVKIIKDMEEKGHIIMKEKKSQVVKIGERSGAQVEYIVAKQWYVKYLDKKEYFFEMAQKFNWYPQFMKVRLENWIKGLNWDWGFSRQRHFGIPLPVWYDENGKIYLPEEDELPVDPTSYRPKNVPKNIKLVGESDVMDTWFTSASTPYLAIDLVSDESMKKKLFPMSLRPQAHDIISFWLFYTMAKSNLLTKKNPFNDVIVSGFVLDPQGKKMSKSKGNTVSPQEIIEKYSSDGIRFAAAGTKLGSDIPYQEKEIQSGVKVSNKIYNACKFADMLLKDFDKKDRKFEIKDLNSIDRWILYRYYDVMQKATEAFEKYDYATAKSLYEGFFMRDIADNYLEIVKERLWKPEIYGEIETKKAQKALYTALYGAVRGLAPFMPYITEEVYQNFFSKFENEKSIHQSVWPNWDKKEDKKEISQLIEIGNNFINVVATARKFKAENQMSMKDELNKIEIICDTKTRNFIEESIADLKSVTWAKEIIFSKGEFKVKIKK